MSETRSDLRVLAAKLLELIGISDQLLLSSYGFLNFAASVPQVLVLSTVEQCALVSLDMAKHNWPL